MKLADKFSVAAVAVVLLKFLISGITLTLGTYSVAFNLVDSMTIAAILTPILGANHLGSYIDGKKDKTNDKQS